MNLLSLHQKNTKDLSTSSQNWIRTKSISVKRTSGGRRYYQKIQRDLEGYAPEWNPIGEYTLARIKNYGVSLKSEEKQTTEEKSSSSVEQKEKCLTLKQKLSSIMTSFFQMNGTTNS